jgi:hypothetical protein
MRFVCTLLLLPALCACLPGRYDGALFWGQDGSHLLSVQSECRDSAEAVAVADRLGLLWAQHSRVAGWGYERVVSALRGAQVCLIDGVEMCGGVLAVGCAAGMGEGAWAATVSPRGPVDWALVLLHEIGHLLEANGMTGVETRTMEPLIEHAMRVCDGQYR